MHFLLSLASGLSLLPCFQINLPEVSNVIRLIVFYNDLFQIGPTLSRAYTFPTFAMFSVASI